MAIVIHTIKGNGYAYDHHRVGNKVVCEYLGPVSKGGTKNKYSLRQAEHGGGAKLHNMNYKTSPEAPKGKDTNKKDKGQKLHNTEEEHQGKKLSSLSNRTNGTPDPEYVGPMHTGKQKIPTYSQWLNNMKGKMENMGGSLKINKDGSATATMNGQTGTRSKKDLELKYKSDVKEWESEGFKHQ